MGLKPKERIPLHAHSNFNDGGNLSGPAVRKAAGLTAAGESAGSSSPHTLDGDQHLDATGTGALLATTGHSGLLLPLSGSAGDALRGDGTWGATTTGGSFDVTPPLSVALPPWVKPSGSGVITNDAQGRITIDSGSGYKAFPGMAFLEGRLHLVYRDATGHNSAGGVIKYRTSDDLVRTWSSAASIASPAGTEDLRDPTIVALSSGRLLLAYHVATTGGTIAVRIETIYSDNRGQSWSSLYVVPDTFSGEVAGSSPALELPDGTIMLGGYGESGSTFFAVVWFSTDGGLTFGNQTTVASSGSRNYEEPQFRLLASGKIVGLLRTNGTGHTWRVVSTDGGATWSAPADVLTAGLGRPDFVEFFPGALFLMIRQASGDNDCYWAVSWDEGATWTALQETDSGETKDEMYAAPVVLAPGYIAVAYSLEVSSSDSDLYLRYYHDGYGIDPLGNLTVLTGGGPAFATPAIVLGTAAAAGAAATVIRSDATIVAFDATVPTTQAFGDAAATGSAAVAARRDHVHGMPAEPAGGHVHVADEVHLSDGSTTTYTLDAAFEPGSVLAFNTTTLAYLTVTETAPDQATVSAAGSSGDKIAFSYAASAV